MRCEIIRDLALNYFDEVTNEVSNQAIEEHLNECEQCRKYYETMKKEMETERYIELDRAAKTEIKPFKKIRQNMLAIACLTAVICAWIFGCLDMYCNNLSTAVPEDAEITYKKIDNMLYIYFLPKKNNTYLEVWNGYYENGETEEDIPVEIFDRIEVLKGHELPFMGKEHVPITVTYYIMDNNTIFDENNGKYVEYTDDQVITINFGDTAKAVKIKDLFESGTEKVQELKL